MATPTSPGVVSSVNLTGDNNVDSVIYGIKWGGATGTRINLTYSFNRNSSEYLTTYGIYDEPENDLGSLTSTQKGAVRKALAAWSKIANINFTEVFDSSTVAGDLRFARSSALETALSYLPGENAEAGDVWFNYSSQYDTVTEGSYGYTTFMHEIGHALGLKHLHESGFSVVANQDFDTTRFSIMSYRSYVGQPIGSYQQNFYPTTPMLNDIAAIQYLYGANTNTRSGDNNYSWSNGEQILETIWDGGGVDRIDWSNQSTAATINLNAGEWSELGASYWNGQTNERKTLAIAYDTIIENAKGGTKSDRIIGNTADNQIGGGGGNDTLSGNDGDDILFGNSGNDLLEGDAGNDRLNGGTNNDTITGGAGRDTIYGDLGNDVLVGGDDSDLLYGNEGRDYFVLEVDRGKDTIRDFVDGVDFFSLDGELSFNDLSIGNNTEDTGTIIRDESNSAIAFVSNIDASLISESDFVEI